MTSSRPYLLKAIYDWLTDNQLTPYLMVDAEMDGVIVPTEYIQDGRIILNIAFSAVKDLNIQMDMISFSARFSGNPMQVYIPMSAALALYSAENGQGMFFPEEQGQAGEEEQPLSKQEQIIEKEKAEQKGSAKSKAPFLKVVK